MAKSSSDSTGFGMAVGHKYIENNFEEGAKERVSVLVNNLISAFKELIGESEWMDEETQVDIATQCAPGIFDLVLKFRR